MIDEKISIGWTRAQEILRRAGFEMNLAAHLGSDFHHIFPDTSRLPQSYPWTHGKM